MIMIIIMLRIIITIMITIIGKTFANDLFV